MKVLISGASLAGPSLAYWLTRAGHDVTVVERAARPREGGSPIDVRGPAVNVAERMGLLPAIQKAQTHTEGIAFVDVHGRRQVHMDPGVFAEPGGQDIELERADLVTLLYDASRNDADYRAADELDRYEREHRPLVAKAQASVSRGAGMLVPATKGAIWRRNKLMRMVMTARRLFSR